MRSAITSRRLPLRRQRDEDRYLLLVATVVVATAAKRLRLGLGDPGHLEQQDEQEDRHDDRHPSVGDEKAITAHATQCSHSKK